ncbi:MAG: HAMP domain-containing sensor histidine kinase [Pseudomonadota bacterium]
MLREMQAQFVRLMLPMAFVNFGNATVVALSYMAVVDIWRLLAWYGVMTAFCVMQLLAGIRFNRTKMPDKVSGRLLRKAETMSIVLGILWGALPFIFNDDNHLSHLFLNFVIAGMCAGTVAILGPVCRISIRFLFGAIPLVYMANLFSDSPYAMPISFLTTALMFAVIVGATRNAHHVREMIEREVDADTARQQMLDAIESTNDAFAFFDQNDRLILANQRHIELVGDNLRLPDKSDNFFGSTTIKQGGHWLLQARHSAPHDGYVLVHTDITDLKMRERELVEARKEAEEADAAKTRFLSTMSHELRSPLNIILGFSRLMASDSKVDLSWEDVAEYSDSINSSSAHLLQLIDDIIDYSKVGLDKFLLEPSAVEITELIESTVNLAASFEHIKDRSVFDIQVSPDLKSLRIDESICKRVMMNLLSNAIRYQGEDERIIIRAGLDREGSPFIAVRDFGEGIPDDEVEQVFEAFYQSHSARKAGRGGTGLGLTLCRHLARLHDGDVLLKSRVGTGTTATFVLPKTTYIRPTDVLSDPNTGRLTDEAAA